MGSLTTVSPANFYKDLFHIGNSNLGLDGTLRNVEDGLGNSSVLQLSTSAVGIQGNLTISGTVDGRDVATDGTKLDGIEAGADVTDATNVAAAGAVMDGDFSTNGIMIRAASGAYTNRSVVAGSSKMTVTNGDGVSGNISVDVDTDQLYASNHIKRSTSAGLTASTTQSQGQGLITTDVNEFSTVANPNDTCTLPTATAGMEIVIINNGANTLQIFPNTSDDLGAGVDTATTLAASGVVRFISYDSTNWVQA